MNSQPNTKNGQPRQRASEWKPTRRGVLAAGGAVALTSLAGCTALNGLLDRGAEQLVGTTKSSPAAFYPGRTPSSASPQQLGAPGFNEASDVFYSIAPMQVVNEPQFFRSGPTIAKRVPATIQTNGREFALEGWSIQSTTEVQDYNSARSNKPSSEWWGGPDDDSDDDGLGDTFVAIQDIELELLGHLVTAMAAVEARDASGVNPPLEAFTTASTKALKKGNRLSSCESTVCGTLRENMAAAEEYAQSAQDAVDDGDWTVAASELAAAEVLVLGDIKRLDDELEERRPSRPRFSDLIVYMRDEPTIGERFTVCLPNAKLPGGPPDRLPEEIKPEVGLGLFAGSDEDGGRRPPFHDQYNIRSIQYDDDGCFQLGGPISLHEDLACQNIISANLDTYRTANREIVGYSTEGGAVVSGVPASADTDGKCVFVAPDGTLREPESLNSWGQERTAGDVTVSQTLVCPVAVTPADCPCPLPGLFYIRRLLHDEQVILAGGWMLDEGALYEDSATLLFDEGPTEVASVTKEDVESDDYDGRIVEQFSRDRSRFGSALVSGTPESVADSGMMPGPLNGILEGDNDEQMADGGGEEVNILGMEAEKLAVAALDVPLVHLVGAGQLSMEEKMVHANGLIDEVREDDKVE